MATTNMIRTFRDGKLTLRDGTSPTPQSIVVPMSDGSFSWTEWSETIEVADRGSLNGGHLRKGFDHPVTLSFNANWTQLIGKSHDDATPLQLYEFITFADGTDVVSTSQPGEQSTLTFEFEIRDPANMVCEKIIFSKVYRETLSLLEGDPANQIRFTGKSSVASPAIVRS